MNSHLLLLTLGPVQEFIAQARRTRDLWYGSHLLSELGRAAARALTAGGAQLVFPALEQGDPELEPCPAPLRPTGRPPANIPNKLLAIVPAGVEPADLARQVRHAVFDHWRDGIAAPVRNRCAALLAPGVDNVWAEQIDTFVEFLAGWAPLDDYTEARRAVERAIAGRKHLRDFQAWRHSRVAAPKSSLDGARDTVLRTPRERDRQLVHKYRIEDGEQLDAVGLVKRAGGEPEQFVPIVNIALARWVRLAEATAPSELDRLREACGKVGLARVARADLPCAAPFQFDASILLRSRWEAIFKERGLEGAAESWGRAHVEPVLRKMADPYPYVACLVADGDHMGRALDRLPSAEDHRALSRALSQFAAEARAIVEQDHSGVLIYSGGDDVLAFVSLPEAPACAEDLRLRFEHMVAGACGSLPEQTRPTLSVGIGVGHVMEGMGDLLALAREAEAEAKRERNSLAVLVDMRSGGRLAWRARWVEDPAGALKRSMAHLEDKLSARKVYEIAAILRRFPADTADARWRGALAREVARALSRVGEGEVTPDQVDLNLQVGGGYQGLRTAVEAWVNRVLIARVFARAVPRPRNRNQEVAE